MTTPTRAHRGTLGKFKLLRLLGRGSMGVVYRALDTDSYRVVALKTTNQAAPHVVDDVDRFRDQLRREARVVQNLHHPNIVQFYETDTIGDICYFAMEYVKGINLLDLLKRQGPPSPRSACLMMLQVLRALHYAHSKGVIHRDIKPSNLILNPKRQIKVTDFGVAKIMTEASTTHFFETGDMVGTPSYMSPEQIMGEPVDHRSDIFSVGCVLYKLLTNRRPFTGSTVAGMLNATVSKQPRRASRLNPAVPTRLDAVIAKALMKRPEERYEHVGQMMDDLQEVVRALSLAGRSSAPPPRRPRQPPPPDPAEEEGTLAMPPRRGVPRTGTIVSSPAGVQAGPAAAALTAREAPPRPAAPEAAFHRERGAAYLERGRYLAAIIELRKALVYDMDDQQAKALLDRAIALRQGR